MNKQTEWNTRRSELTVEYPADNVLRLASLFQMTKDGEWLIGLNDRRVRRYPIDPHQLAKGSITREITTEEKRRFHLLDPADWP